MRMSSSLEKSSQAGPLEKGLYTLRVKSKEDTNSKNTGNPMVILTWEVADGPDSGKEIRYDNIVLGGKNDKGEPINPFRLANFLDACGVPWKCTKCNNAEIPRRLYVGQGADIDGVKRGKHVCPDCKNPDFGVDYDTDTFVGASCRGVVDIKKGNDDREFNVINKYLPLSD